MFLKRSIDVLALVAILTFVSCTSGVWPYQAQSETVTTLYLVRHAEKELSGTDPELTGTGQARAVILAEILTDANIETVWSTDYRRTRDTAGPLADRQNIDISFYDPRDLETFAETLTDMAQTALIVGHSNTTPALVAALGGDPGLPIEEMTEYDRLYVVTINRKTGEVQTDLRRYGGI